MAGNVKLLTSAGGGVVLDTATTTATDVTVKVPVTGVNNGTLVCSDSSGNVGIGTSSPDVFGRAETRTVGVSSSGTTSIGINAATGNNPSLYLGVNGTRTVQLIGNSSEPILNSGTSLPLLFGTNFTERMRIDSSGNVGIGTSSPGSKLDVYGADVAIQNSYSNGVLSVGVSSGVSSRLQLQGAESIRFTTYGSSWTERMRIDSSGNLLVGTTSQVNSGLFCSVGNLNNIYTATFKNTATQGAGQSFVYMVNSAGNKAGSIDHTGTTTVAYTTSSDYRLKENVQPMVGALDKVLQLNPVTYRWKEDKKDGQGFIAHELQAVVPDCVTGEKDAVDADGNPVYQGIDTSFLVATLTKAIQELNEKVEAQAAEIAALKGAA